MAARRSSDPIKAAARKSRSQRRVGQGAACACGEKRSEALIAGRVPTICASCDRKQRGEDSFDGHDVAGRKNSCVKIEVPVNDHRAVLSTAQYAWPKRTLQNPDGSPLIAAAGCIRGAADTIIYLVETLLVWIVQMLEALDSWLSQQHGARWWIGTPVEAFAP